MCVLHAAELANGNAFARFGQLRIANVFTLAGFAALGGSLVRGGDGAVFGDVFLSFLLTFRSNGERSCEQKRSKD